MRRQEKKEECGEDDKIGLTVYVGRGNSGKSVMAPNVESCPATIGFDDWAPQSYYNWKDCYETGVIYDGDYLGKTGKSSAAGCHQPQRSVIQDGKRKVHGTVGL